MRVVFPDTNLKRFAPTLEPPGGHIELDGCHSHAGPCRQVRGEQQAFRRVPEHTATKPDQQTPAEIYKPFSSMALRSICIVEKLIDSGGGTQRINDVACSLQNDFENCKNRLSQSPDWICEQFVSNRGRRSWRLRLTG